MRSVEKQGRCRLCEELFLSNTVERGKTAALSWHCVYCPPAI